jgi:hypothetical protein
MMRNTFKDCFGIRELKDVWAKEKDILKDWI